MVTANVAGWCIDYVAIFQTEVMCEYALAHDVLFLESGFVRCLSMRVEIRADWRFAAGMGTQFDRETALTRFLELINFTPLT